MGEQFSFLSRHARMLLWSLVNTKEPYHVPKQTKNAWNVMKPTFQLVCLMCKGQEQHNMLLKSNCYRIFYFFLVIFKVSVRIGNVPCNMSWNCVARLFVREIAYCMPTNVSRYLQRCCRHSLE